MNIRAPRVAVTREQAKAIALSGQGVVYRDPVGRNCSTFQPGNSFAMECLTTAYQMMKGGTPTTADLFDHFAEVSEQRGERLGFFVEQDVLQAAVA